MKYKFILFDLDGTLFDYDKAESIALQKTFEQFAIRYDPSYLTEYKRLNEMIWHEYEQGIISQKRLRKMASLLSPPACLFQVGKRPLQSRESPVRVDETKNSPLHFPQKWFY